MSLDNQIKDFEKAKSGTELRSTLISLLEALVRDTNYGASDLSGYLVGDFLTIEDMMSNYDSYCEVINYVTVSEVSGTIHDKLSKISDVKEQMRQAINTLYKTDIIKPEKTENPHDIYKFEDYAEVINAMPQNVDVRVLMAGQIEENGEFEAEEGKAYGAVVVAVPQPVLTTRAISKNGTYYAQQDGADGYSSVTVSITGNIASYTVRFMSEDGSQVLWTSLNVPYDGFASYNGTTPVSSDPNKIFTGWNPAPEHIMADTDCYPIFEVVSQSTEEISDSWETIAANHGVGYPLGSYKYLTFDQSSELESNNGMVYSGINPWKLMKVGVGEGGSRSTWLGINYLTYGSGNTRVPSLPLTQEVLTGSETSYDWGISKYRTWLNSKFLAFLPLYLRNAIVAVPKYSIGINYENNEYVKDKASRDKIWLPTPKELFGSIGNLYSGYTGDLQINLVKCFDNLALGSSYANVILSSAGSASEYEVINNLVEVDTIITRDFTSQKSQISGNTLYATPSYLLLTSQGSNKHISQLDTGTITMTQFNQSLGCVGFCL